MKLNDYIHQEILKGRKFGYLAVVKNLGFGLLAMLFCPGRFEKNNQIIENIVENGTVRVFFGGISMVLVGPALIFVGFVTSAAILLALACLPVTAACICVSARVRAWLRTRKMLKAVDGAVRKINRGE